MSNTFSQPLPHEKNWYNPLPLGMVVASVKRNRRKWSAKRKLREAEAYRKACIQAGRQPETTAV